MQQVCQKLQFCPTADAFSEVRTARFPKWWGPGYPHGTDDFKAAWGREKVWANPPFSKYNEVLEKAVAENAHIFVVMPVRSDRVWYRRAVAMMESSWVVPAGTFVFYIPGRSVGPTKWPVMFAILRGDWGSRPHKRPVEPSNHQPAMMTKVAKRTRRRWRLAVVNAQK